MIHKKMGDEFTKAGINRETQRHALRGSVTTDKGAGKRLEGRRGRRKRTSDSINPKG